MHTNIVYLHALEGLALPWPSYFSEIACKRYLRWLRSMHVASATVCAQLKTVYSRATWFVLRRTHGFNSIISFS